MLLPERRDAVSLINEIRGAPAPGIPAPNKTLSARQTSRSVLLPKCHPIHSPMGGATRSLARDVMASLTRITLALRRTEYRGDEPLHASLFPGLQFPVAGKKPLLIGIQCES